LAGASPNATHKEGTAIIQVASLFNQLLQHFPRTEFASLVKKNNAERCDPPICTKNCSTPRGGLNDARADEQVLPSELGIAHSFRISLEVVCLGTYLVGHFGIGGMDGTKRSRQLFDFPLSRRRF
jgi:hypothetical protein